MNPAKEKNLPNLAMQKPPEEEISVDDFIRQLEEKEKNLHISSDLEIEIDIADFDDTNIPDFLVGELEPLPKKPEKAKSAVVHQKPKEAKDTKKAVDNANEISKLKNEIEHLKAKLAKSESSSKEIFEDMRRRHQDFENFKSRTERERADTFQTQIGSLAKQLLPVLDNLDRGLGFAANNAEIENKEYRQLFDGIVLINQQLTEVLASMGVQPIQSVGEKFDPYYHEAVATEPRDDVEQNVIVFELLRGYKVGEKVVRPSMVKVAMKPNQANPQTEATEK